MELQENPGLSTMHHYFYSYPWLTLCPLRSNLILCNCGKGKIDEMPSIDQSSLL